ncbi:helix-turn-helix transcriptional regulator [Streptomyces sp. Vc74B-19]|uniref:helix-turn-helix domain-containing protein n=1 Tax=Streptomyces sp. Vc74B-19 TaxID=2741324 RepID=UPI001BFCADE9|nr:helix-turn-helix transcriptional regulator [Streptomyces sp. Vc74B-19]MBT3163075.1 helix-turn-helix transcriptional regulator [Streptomyces sp. Vc74B-19]
MSARPRSRRQEQVQFATELRAAGRTWPEAAAAVRHRYRVNARVAPRLARGLSQRQVAELWNQRWPDDPKTFKNISTWELWPASTGHAPSLDTLDRLAQLYECSVADLLADLPTHGHPPPHPSPAPASPAPAVGADLLDGRAAEPLLLTPQLASTLVHRLHDVRFEELAQALIMWVQQANPGLNRRELLLKISTALTVAAAAPLLDIADADERDRVVAVLDDPGRLDLATITHAERVLQHYRRQGDVLGPQIALQTALAQRQVIADLIAGAPEDLRPRVLTVYAELSQMVGWQLYNLGDYRAAQYYYDDARTAAHDAENTELVTYVLCTMSQLATWQNKPRVGIDHAIAAQAWAAQTDSPAALGYAADVAARAFAAAQQHDKAQRALEQEHAAVRDMAASPPLASWWYFYDESFYWGTSAECALVLGTPEKALAAARTSLPMIDPTNVHNYAHTLALQSQAHLQQGDISEASTIVGDIARISGINRSPRITQRIADLRTALTPWQRSRAVRTLDDLLASYRLTGSSSTNKS